MKKTVRCVAAVSALLSAVWCGAAFSQTLSEANSAYLERSDYDYAYSITKKLGDFRTNKALGYRPAGSEAEFLAGEMIKSEMERIGLKEVTKDAFTVDGWTYKGAQLTYPTSDGDRTVELGGYQTTFVTDGTQEFSIIDGKQGTEADLAALDVKGKLVLIDINQRENWWINYPAYEAHLHGAAAVIAAQNGGYAEVSDEALNAQDVCGPEDAPAFSITRKDADAIRAYMKANGTGEIKVKFNADSRVYRDVTSYNIHGKIPGKDPDTLILVSGHYDAYFTGFQDDSSAIGMMLAIAKALIDSGYKPQKTIVFCAMGAEEWGVSNTRYDWSTGAYNQIFRVRPEWAGRTIANINFEHPMKKDAESDKLRSSYELKTYLSGVQSTVPVPEGLYADGVEVVVPNSTWSDDFSLSIAGVPASVTTQQSFSNMYYHSQFDNLDTYNADVAKYHQDLFGKLIFAYDRCAVSPLDFGTRLALIRASLNPEVLTAEQMSALTASLDRADAAAKAAWEKVSSVNAAYGAAVDAGSADAEKIFADNAQLNSAVLSAFKYAQDNLLFLTWEDESLFPHEKAQKNVAALKASIAALEKGEVQTALDEYLWLVDNNWYAYDWSRATYDYFTKYVLEQPADRLMWGAGRVQSHTDLYDVVKSLQSKKAGGDLSAEIAALKAAEEQQLAELEKNVAEGTAALDAMAEALGKML